MQDEKKELTLSKKIEKLNQQEDDIKKKNPYNSKPSFYKKNPGCLTGFLNLFKSKSTGYTAIDEKERNFLPKI
jgi:hypothetical protein